MANDNWIEVSKLKTTCPICGKSDWCKISQDGNAVICNRISEGSFKTLKMGWVHMLQDNKQNSRKLRQRLTLSEYAIAKKLPVLFLKFEFSISEYCGGLVMPYKDDGGTTIATRFRLAMKGKRRFSWKKGSKASKSLYNAHRLSEYKPYAPLYVVEGESDTQTGHYHGIQVLGIPGKTTTIGYLAEKIIEYRFQEVNIVVEPDAKGQIDLDIASELAERNFQGKLYALNLPVKDLSELHCKYPDYFNGILGQAKEKAALVSIEVKPLIDRLNDIRDENLKQFERRSRLAETVKNEMLCRGEFIRTAEEQYYYFDKFKKRLHVVSRESSQTERLLYKVAGLNKADPDFLYIVNELANFTAINGRLSEVFQFSRYQNDRLYLSRFDGQIYIVDGDRITTADNGTDGVLFLDHPDWQPWQCVDGNGMTHADVIGNINFDSNEILNTQEYKRLFVAYIFGLFFRDLTQGAVIAALIGEKGSGKTTATRIIGKILFGDGFEVRSVEKGKEDNFLVMISTQHFLGLDNLDGNISWLNDHLATIATGTYIIKRKLYTTNEEYRIKPRVFIAISSRTPAFKRDDVADRLLIFRLKRFEKFIAERVLLEKISQNRNSILSHIVSDLNRIVKELKTQTRLEIETDFRMADFAILGESIWRALGGNDDAEIFKTVIGKMKRAQEAFSIEDDPLPDLISEWVKRNPCSTGVTAAELFANLTALAEEKRVPFNLKSSRSLGRQMGLIAEPMLELFGIRISHFDGNGRVRYYNFIRESEGDFIPE